PLSLHDALPIARWSRRSTVVSAAGAGRARSLRRCLDAASWFRPRPVVSAAPRGFGSAPWSRRCIVVSATATDLPYPGISLEATRDRRVQQRDLPTSGPRSPHQRSEERPGGTE